MGLITGFGFKPHIGNLLALGFKLMNLAFHNLIAAGKPHITKAVVDPGTAIFKIFIKP